MKSNPAMKLDTTEGANLINIQYGVAFGVMFAFCFYQDTPSSPIRFAIPVANLLPFLGLIIYFFLDWLTANFAKDKFVFKDWMTYAWSLAIWYLGSVVILINSAGDFRYLWVGLYFFVAGLFDLFGYKNIFYNLATSRSFLWMSLAGIKTILGFVLLLPAFLVTICGATASLHEMATVFIIIVSIAKLFR
jgi:hypothetical protein